MNWLGKQGSLFHTLSRWWLLISWWHKEPGPWFNINMSSYQYRKSHCGDKTILPPSYLHNGISYTGKTTSLYWIKAQVISSHGIKLVLMEHSVPNAKGVNIFQGYFFLEFGESWWHHQMETFSALLAICAGNSPVSGEFPPHKGQWHGALMFSLICTWINGWVNNGEAGDLRPHRTHYDVTVMIASPSLRAWLLWLGHFDKPFLHRSNQMIDKSIWIYLFTYIR